MRKENAFIPRVGALTSQLVFCWFFFSFSKADIKRLHNLFLGHLNSYLLRSHSSHTFTTVGLYKAKKARWIITILHRKKSSGRGTDGHAVTAQNAMYMTYIKTIVRQRSCKLWLQSTEINIQYIIINTFV